MLKRIKPKKLLVVQIALCKRFETLAEYRYLRTINNYKILTSLD